MFEFIDRYSGKDIFLVLSGFFTAFYGLQIPMWTSNADVLIYSCRALEDYPILNYTFLGNQNDVLPNYHLGHTILLWLAYHIVPDFLTESIWPSGLVSAISGAFSVGLTFLIWLELGFSKKRSAIIAIVTGVIPAIWYHNLIGEIYSLQFCFTLLFLYWFLRNKLIPAAFAFAGANLVSPLASLSFGLILLAPKKKPTLTRGFLVGLIALAIYAVIYYLADPNFISKFFAPAFSEADNRTYIPSITWKIYRITTYVFVNFSLFLYCLIRGIFTISKNSRKVIIYLIIAITPQIVLVLWHPYLLYAGSSFLLLVYWALSFPIGLVLFSNTASRGVDYMAFLCVTLAFVFIWLIPDVQIGKDRHRAGLWLKNNVYEELKLIGDWHIMSVLVARYGWDIEKLREKAVDRPIPNTSDLVSVQEESLIVSQQKRSDLRMLLSKLPIKRLKKDVYNPFEEIKEGSIKYLYENKAIALHRWDYTDKNNFE